MAVATQSAPAQSSLFGVPGITRHMRTRENNDGNSTTLSSSSAVDTLGLIPFKQTDVVFGWEFETVITNTFAAGGGTAATSPYFPYNFLGITRLNMQNQYDTIYALSGIDLALWQLIRPIRPYNMTQLYTVADTLYSNQSNLVSAGNYTSASGTLNLRWELPAGLWFDEYYALQADGKVLGRMGRVFVSPQYMSGTSRLVTPAIQYNPAIGTVLDNAPYQVTGGSPTFSGTSVLKIQRTGVYQPQGAADSPPVFNWQYTRKAQKFSLSGLSSANLNVPLNGQILSIIVRLFDPAASSGKGAVIGLSNVTEADIVYGSGFYRAQDRPFETQAVMLALRKALPVDGVLFWDFATNQFGERSNAAALNTMNTSGIQVQLTFSGAQSSSAYAVVLVEALTWVQA